MLNADTDSQENSSGKIRRVYLRFLFFNAGLANVAFALSYLFAFERASQWLGVEAVPDIPLLSMHAKLLAIAILIFGIVYFMAAWRPNSETSFCLIAFGAAGKLAVFGITLAYAVTTDVSWGYVRVSVFDLLYGVLFVEYLIWFRRSQHSSDSIVY